MNILRVISSMDPASGGPCQGIRNSIPQLSKIGVKNEVVCLDSPNANFLGNDNFLIHAIGPSKGPWAYSPLLIPWLLDNLARFDVVIAHGLWLYHSYAVRKALIIASRNNAKKLPRLYVMPHGMLDPYFQKAEGRKLKALRNWLYWKLIEAKVVNGADGILFTCEEELILARQPFEPYKPKKELNVGYGVPEPPDYTEEMKQAFEEKTPQLNGCQYFLFLSRLHQKKGVDILVDAYKALMCKFDNRDANIPKLVIAGPGLETDYGLMLQKKVEEDPFLQKQVIFTGMLTGNSKWGAFYACKAFVLPSHQENFGIAVVEALAVSKPVLISNKVNIWREIYNGKGGFVDKDSTDGAASLLSNFLNLTEEEVKIAGINARKVYEENFAIAPVAVKLFNTLKEN
jgi:glycosyltransferase involved in cell wall biosynthesis